MRNPVVTLGIIACILLGSCKTDDVDAPQARQAENFVFHTNNALYDRVLKERSNAGDNNFTIDNIEPLKTDGRHVLRVTVTHARGCSQDFDVIWGGYIMESFPEQTDLFLRLPGTCDSGNEPVQRVLLIDLDEFIGLPDLVGRATFHIKNGSVAPGVNDLSISFR